jgi:hypothetical protein
MPTGHPSQWSLAELLDVVELAHCDCKPRPGCACAAQPCEKHPDKLDCAHTALADDPAVAVALHWWYRRLFPHTPAADFDSELAALLLAQRGGAYAGPQELPPRADQVLKQADRVDVFASRHARTLRLFHPGDAWRQRDTRQAILLRRDRNGALIEGDVIDEAEARRAGLRLHRPKRPRETCHAL